MALIDLWKTGETRNRKLFQLITFAGTGKLGDGNATSEELRALLAEVSADELERYANECLTEPFEGNGFALQDIVNEAGRRLGYRVDAGYYRGRVAAGNQDALWTAPDGWKLIVEVKTTSTYQIQLGKIAGYRARLIMQDAAKSDQSSILVVVGRENTEDFEAQIRGSRFAWIIRMISVQALFRLLKIGINDPAALAKVHRIFVPEEYTKVDRIIDLVFETAEAARGELRDGEAETSDDMGAANDSRPADDREDGTYLSRVGRDVKAGCLRRVERKLGIALKPLSGTFFVDDARSVGVMCAVSSQYRNGRYWFAFHERHQQAIERYSRGFVVLGCGTPESVLCLDYAWFRNYLSSLNASKTTPVYHHIHIDHVGPRWEMKLKGRERAVDVTQFLL